MTSQIKCAINFSTEFGTLPLKSAFVIPSNKGVEIFEHDTQEDGEEAIANVNKRAIEVQPPAIITIVDCWMSCAFTHITPDGKPSSKPPERTKAVIACLIQPDGSVSWERIQLYSYDITFGKRLEQREQTGFKQSAVKRWDISDGCVEPVQGESRSKPKDFDELATPLLEEFRAHKDEPHAIFVPLLGDNEKKYEVIKFEKAIKLRKLFPAEVSIVFIVSDGVPGFSISWKTRLSTVIGWEGKEGDLVLLIDDDAIHGQLEQLLAGETWEDCIHRVNPKNDKILRCHHG